MLRGLARRLGLAVAGCAMLVSGAEAQNYDGDGLVRFGLFGAGTFFKADPRFNDLSPPDSEFASSSLNSAAFGFTAGYDYRLHRAILIGVEADATIGDWGTRVNGVAFDVDYMASLRGRLGAYMTPDFLVYLTGGVAWAGLKVEDTLATPVDTARTRTGGIYGIGLEYDLRTISA